MNKISLLSLGVVLITAFGCAQSEQKVESFIDNPATLLADPHFASYEEKKNALEHRYLAKEITYAEYQEGLKELDNEYTAEVNHREAILSDQP